MTDRVTANLPAKDMDATEAFYARLGFQTDFKDDGWMILSRGPLELEFFPHPTLDPPQSWFSACLRIADLDGLWANWSRLALPEHGIARLQGPVWTEAEGLWMFALVDANGSLIRCIEEAP